MAYERDDDRMTRGAGAIAAFDQRSRNAPGRLRRRAQQMRATKAHDARMVAVERGALGRVSLSPVGVRVAERLLGGSISSRVVPVTVLTAPPVNRVPPTPAYTGGNDLAIGPLDLPPPPPLPPPAPVTPKPPVQSGNGGSAPGVTPTGGPGAITTFDPSQVLPEIPAPSSGPSMQRVLLIGGAALAAFWLLRRSS